MRPKDEIIFFRDDTDEVKDSWDFRSRYISLGWLDKDGNFEECPGYSRQEVTDSEIIFPSMATGSWTLTHFEVFDNKGNKLIDSLDRPIAVVPADTVHLVYTEKLSYE